MSDKKMVLVTGGKGTVGFALKELVDGNERREDEEWHFVDIEDADLRDQTETRQLFERIRPTHVIHCADMVGGIYYNIGKQLDIFRTNTTIDGNVLGAALQSGVKHVISFSSVAAFSKDSEFEVMDETMIQSGEPHESMYGYGMSKRNVTIFNRLCNEQHGLAYTSVVPTNIFGPQDNYHLQDGHVVSNLIRKVHEATLNKTPLVILGTGRTRRQFIYSRDVARIVVWMIRHYNGPDPVILAEDVHSEITIEQLAKLICKVMDFHGPIEFDTSKIVGAAGRRVTNRRLMELMPEFKFTPMKEALKEAADWFVANYETARK